MPVKFKLKPREGYDDDLNLIPVAEPVEDIKPEIIIPKNRIVTLDDMAADNGTYKMQEEWIGYWNDFKDGRLFASMKDMYAAFGQIQRNPGQYKNPLASLRDAFDKRWVITSTRINYKANSMQAEIIHHYGSNGHKDSIQLEIPFYDYTKIMDVLNSEVGLAYMRALFGTEDDKKDISDTLKFVSGKKEDEIFVWTPDLDGRSRIPVGAALLSYGSGEFRVYGCNIHYIGGSDFSNGGCSFGVRYASIEARKAMTSADI
ncbi:MAG: hypothetical protein V1906_00590 [Candidatus Woesearchaeota archaeon]